VGSGFRCLRSFFIDAKPANAASSSEWQGAAERFRFTWGDLQPDCSADRLVSNISISSDTSKRKIVLLRCSQEKEKNYAGSESHSPH